MIAFPSMLVGPAKSAGMKVPPDDKVDEFQKIKDEFPHFFVFCLIQLGMPMRTMTEHWENAKVIAEIPEDEIMKVNLLDLINKGLRINT
jgi:hypothetical protein